MSILVPMRCPVGCDVELGGMGPWAPYRVCPRCGTGRWQPPERSQYWQEGAPPSFEQEQSWGSRDALREQIVGAGPGRLLDVGCGFGHFLQWALRHGWDAWGWEYDSWARASGVVPDRVVESLDAVTGNFELITLWDVLEHVPEPLPLLSKLSRLAAPGGRIVVASPNFEALKLRWPLLRLSPERFNARVRPEEHPLAFTESGLRLALERSGFGRVELLRPPLANHSNPALNRIVRAAPRLRLGLFGIGHRATS